MVTNVLNVIIININTARCLVSSQLQEQILDHHDPALDAQSQSALVIRKHSLGTLLSRCQSSHYFHLVAILTDTHSYPLGGPRQPTPQNGMALRVDPQHLTPDPATFRLSNYSICRVGGRDIADASGCCTSRTPWYLVGLAVSGACSQAFGRKERMRMGMWVKSRLLRDEFNNGMLTVMK